VACALVVPGAADYWWLSAAFLSNYSNSLGVETPHFASVFWSLCIEEHYYLLFPLLVWALPTRLLGGLLLAVLAAEPLLRYWAFNAGVSVFDVIYLQTQFRLDGLAVGGVIALVSGRTGSARSSGLRVAILLAVVGAAIQVVTIPYGSMRPTTESPVACAVRFSAIALVFGAAVMTCTLATGSRWTSPLRSPFLRWIAKLSYCLYLVHVAVFQLADAALSPIRDSAISALGGPGFVLARALLLSMTAAGVAQCSWVILERPMLRIKDRFLK
jgi:peptidoglycan/LPS O-acetylase OafA/YrhL